MLEGDVEPPRNTTCRSEPCGLTGVGVGPCSLVLDQLRVQENANVSIPNGWYQDRDRLSLPQQ